MSLGVRQGAYYGRLPEDPRDGTAAPHWNWDAGAVGAWLTELGLGQHSASFVRHQITGDLLEQLEKADLCDLGVDLVGHRLLLLREVAGLRRKAETRERNRVLWQAEEVLHRTGLFGYLTHYLACKPLTSGPDRYTLTSSALVCSHLAHRSHRCDRRACRATDLRDATVLASARRLWALSIPSCHGSAVRRPGPPPAPLS
jgi:hypothetical protein